MIYTAVVIPCRINPKLCSSDPDEERLWDDVMEPGEVVQVALKH